MKYSPLFWPVRLTGNIIYVLDETKLPHKLVYIKIKNYKEACLAIKTMKTRAVGQVILVFYAFLLAIRQNKDKKSLHITLKKIARAINQTRPTLPFKFLTDMILGWAQAGDDLEKNIVGFLGRLKNARIQQARDTSRFIKDKDVVLTHCNVSGLLPLMAEFCRMDKKNVSFIVTETRPYFQGTRLTAWELFRSGFDARVIPDGAVSYVMGKGLVNKVIVGADQLAQNGDIANKIGTYQIAVVAKKFKIPFFVLAPPESRAKTGKDISIEIRPDKEMLEINGVRIAPLGVKGYYPAFDVTPKKLITKHITLKIGRNKNRSALDYGDYQ